MQDAQKGQTSHLPNPGSYCTRPPRVCQDSLFTQGRACPKQGDRPSYPISFFSSLLGIGSGSRQPRLLRESKQEVHGLNRLAGRALH